MATPQIPPETTPAPSPEETAAQKEADRQKRNIVIWSSVIIVLIVVGLITALYYLTLAPKHPRIGRTHPRCIYHRCSTRVIAYRRGDDHSHYSTGKLDQSSTERSKAHPGSHNRDRKQPARYSGVFGRECCRTCD